MRYLFTEAGAGGDEKQTRYLVCMASVTRQTPLGAQSLNDANPLSTFSDTGLFKAGINHIILAHNVLLFSPMQVNLIPNCSLLPRARMRSKGCPYIIIM